MNPVSLTRHLRVLLAMAIVAAVPLAHCDVLPHRTVAQEVPRGPP